MFRPEKPAITGFRSGYANSADLCEVLEREFKPLYLLAFLLTANHQKAERCFAATVEEVLGEESVFKGWALSWIKRSLIRNAIGMVFPWSACSSAGRDLWSAGRYKSGGDDEVNAVTELPPLERFVFVMSILERYSAHDCAVLLGCSTRKVAESRMQALRGISGPAGHFPRVHERAARFVEIPA
jgi:hypothetical protein